MTLKRPYETPMAKAIELKYQGFLCTSETDNATDVEGFTWITLP